GGDKLRLTRGRLAELGRLQPTARLDAGDRHHRTLSTTTLFAEDDRGNGRSGRELKRRDRQPLAELPAVQDLVTTVHHCGAGS
ncbi:MAG: hypothetical protein NZ518_05425, partial [Dehalococcoidia bacterium]|nr:hypothetical protein [Dehalococcoidia bacterium]